MKEKVGRTVHVNGKNVVVVRGLPDKGDDWNGHDSVASVQFLHGYMDVMLFAITSDHNDDEETAVTSEIVAVYEATGYLYMADHDDDYVSIDMGAFLASSAFMVKEQEGWADGDEVKEFDFSTADYWVTFDNDSRPQPINDEDELNYFFEEREYS